MSKNYFTSCNVLIIWKYVLFSKNEFSFILMYTFKWTRIGDNYCNKNLLDLIPFTFFSCFLLGILETKRSHASVPMGLFGLRIGSWTTATYLRSAGSNRWAKSGDWNPGTAFSVQRSSTSDLFRNLYNRDNGNFSALSISWINKFGEYEYYDSFKLIINGSPPQIWWYLNHSFFLFSGISCIDLHVGRYCLQTTCLSAIGSKPVDSKSCFANRKYIGSGLQSDLYHDFIQGERLNATFL